MAELINKKRRRTGKRIIRIGIRKGFSVRMMRTYKGTRGPINS